MRAHGTRKPIAEVQLECVDALQYFILYTCEGKTHSLGVLRSGDMCTLFFRNSKFEMSHAVFKQMCINAADTATLVYFMFQPDVAERLYDLSPLLNMTCA